MRRRKANKRRSRAAHQAIRHFGRAVAKAAPAVAMLILLFAALAVFERLGPGITGFAVAEKTFTTDIGKEITANTEIPVTLEAAPESLSISGKLEGQGTAKAYLVLNGQKYLILDTAQLQKKETESLLTITGRIVEEVQEQTQAITAAAVDTLTTETDNATAINETAAANETRQPAEDNTTTPEPQPSKTITAQLQYNTGTAFDSNNDGIETVKGAIDFTAAATQFSWQAVDEGKLCTRWKADSKETATTTVICNGNSSCCQLVELSPAAESWKEPFQVFYGAYNNAVGYTNNVSAQVIYADYSLETAEAEVDVAYSDWQTLPAMFLPITEFKAACAETCNLPKLLNGSLNATIIVELENAEAATTLTLNTITYTAAVAVNTPPTAAAIPAITVKKNSVATLNLSQYFTDNDGDKLTFAAASDSESIIISVTRGEIAVIEPRRGFVGTATATFTASDGKAETGSTAKITVADANSPPQLLKEIENVTISKGKAATLSLNDYFTDADNDNLSYDYYKADNVTISIDNPAAIATITPDKGFTGKAFTYISAADKENRTAVSNVFTITVTEAAEKEETEEVLGRIEINKPVKWRKTIRLAEESNTTTIIPAEAANITVKENSISIEDKVKVKEAGKAEKKLKDHIKEKAKEKAAVADENITIIIEQNATEVEVDYETPAPTATEQEIDSSRKQIVVASDFHYENVTAYTTLTIEAPASAVKLYWLKKVKKQTTQPGAGVSLAAAAKPTEAASEAAVEQLRRAISSRTPEKLLKSQETSEVYAKSPDAIPANSGSFSKSPVDNTLTLTCFFNAASFDHNGNFSFNDNATKSTSFPSGEILNASGSNDEYSSAGMNVTAIARSDLSFLKSSSDIPVFLRMSDKCALISSKANSGEYSNSSCLISSFLATDFSQKNVYRIFVSTTNCSTYASDSPGLIYISPFLFNSSSLPALDARCSFTAQSVMPLSSSNAFLNSSSLTNLPTFSSMDFLTNPDQFISSNCSIASFTSLGKDTVKDTIPTTSVNLEPQNTVKIFKFCGENTKSCENRGLRLEESPAPFASLAPSAEEGYETVKVLVEDVTKIDSDGNGLIDRLEWIVPSLSNETYEVEITILNVQSYPTVGGNWTVAFNTTSTANLTITAVNGTTYTEIPDNASTTNDLEFLELKCGANVTAPTLITNSSGNLASVFAENWSCDSQTAYHTVKVLTPGVHHQEFNFSSLTAYAHNTATNAICDTGDDQGTCTINSSKQLTNASILNFTNMVIDQNGTLNTGAVNFSTLNGTNLTLSIGGKLTGNFNITVVNLTIDANSLINATGRGYAGVTTGANGTGPGGGDSCGGSVTTCSGAGGGYGGTGGEGTSAPANNGGRGYGSVTEPTDMGSAGGGTYSTSVAGGNGGGAVFINVTDTLSIQGNITANGTDGNINGGGASNYASGGGSGGSIYVRATTLTGTGSITANGGRGGDDSNDGGGGGGGRIALYYTTSTHSGPIQAAGSRAGNTAARAGGAGTIYVKPSSQNADLIIDNNNTGTGTTNFSGLTLNNLTISGLANATLHSDTHLYATNISLNRGQLTTGAGANITATTIAITSGILNHGGANATATNIELTSGTLNHSGTRTLVPYINQLSGTTEAIGQLNATNITIAGTLTTRANLTALNITATNLTITVNGIIDITGKGNLGTAQFAANGTGLGGGDGCGGDSTCESAGAGYGGRGGDGESGPTNNGGRGYGSVTEPTDMGSAGGNTGTTIVAGGSGGGAVFINVTDTLSIQGNITANGTDGNINGGSDGSYGAGGGSGGSIYVRATTLTGTGTIRANGGRPGDDSSSDGGGGGGGRIALYYTTSTYGGPIQAAGLGSANAAREGGAGTIYIKPSSQNADLIIDNNNIGTSGTTNFSGLTLNNLTISGRANATLSPNTLIDAVNISLNNGVLSTDTGANITATTITMTSGTLNHSGTRLHAQYINQLSGTTEAIGQLNATNITIAGTLTTRANLTALNITATNLTVIGSGTIDITGKGNLGTAQYTANGTGPGGGDGCGGDTTCSSAGAGYGGRGGDGLTGPTNNGGQSYGSVTEPTDIGSAGGNTATTIVAGGNGGGAVFINVTDTLSIQGNITANGTDGKIDGGGSTNDGAGGGSGGSIYVRATTLTGTGNITANGGRGGDDSVDGGGGAGGRIALYYTTNEYTGTITAQGNTGGSNANAGGAGTIYYKPAAANPKILIDNGNVARGVTTSGIPITPINASLLTTATTIPELNITGNSNVSINSNYTITSINLTNSALNIPNSNSTITNIYMAASSIDSDEGGLNANLIEVQSGINTLASIQNKAFNATNITIKATLRSRVSSVTANYTLNLSAINLTIEAGGIINVTGAGHQGAASGANGTGPGGGDGCGGDITCSSAGAGYGGTGGAGVNGPTNNGGLSYGSVTEPTDIGSAGGGTGTTSRAGGNGGGAVFINVTGTLNITGQIIANGTNGNIDGGGSSADASGGGSGGSIYVRATTLTGTGSITANGGRGGDDNADGGGGAGGRIALYYTTSTHSGPIQATRSMAATSRSGGNGTIFKAWNLTGITQSLNVTSTGQSQSIRVNGTVLANNVTLNDTGFTEVVWANVSIMVGSTPQGNATSDPNLRYELNFTGPSTDGAYPVNATFVTQTGSVTLTVDTTAPTANISNNASTTTPANGVVNWTGNFTDNSALATYTFGFNDTESFANDTAVTISGTSRLVNVTKTITATRGKNVCGAFYVNDTAGNVNNSAYSCFDVANSPPTVTFTYPGNNALILSGNVSLQAGAGDNDGDAITFYWYINGSFNKTTTVNTTINFSRGNYAANVSANDGTTFSSNTTATFNIDNNNITVHDTLQINFSGHNFSISGAFVDPDGASDIINASIITTAGNCNYRQNTTSGNLFNITYNCTGTSLTATTVTVSANDTRSNTTKTTVTLFYPNSIPAQRHDLLFVNYTGHNFSVSYAVDDNDGALDIMFRNVSTTAGNCNYRENTTSGALFNITYNCTGTSLTTTTVQINISDINGTGTQSSLLTNTYPNNAPTVTFTYPGNNALILSGNVSLQAGAGDADNDAITFYWYINGSFNKTTTVNTTINFSRGNYAANVSANDGTTFSSNTTATFNIDNNNITVHDTLQINFSGHNFSISGAFVDPDGASDIINASIITTAGNCNYRQNTTSGNLFNITYNCTGTSLTATTVTVSANDTRSNTTKTTVTLFYPNSIPAQRHDLQFVNYTGHNFSVSYAVDDNDGALDIMFRNVSTTAGNCNYRENTTSGALFNITYNCTGTSLTTTTVQINISDINGTGTQSSLLTNTYPNNAPTVTFTYPDNNALIYSGNVSLQAGAGDADNDAITFYWYINGSFNKTTTVNTTINFSRGNYAANVSANDGTTFSSNTTATFNIDNNNITVHHGLQFVNHTSQHSFNTSTAFMDPDGSSDMVNRTITTTSGSCNYLTNTTSGNLLNLTFNCTGTALQAATITMIVNDTRQNSTKTAAVNTYPNNAPTQRHDLQFVNHTSQHTFNTSFAVDDENGNEISFRNISTTTGTCSYYTNTTSGALFNVTYNCTGTALTTATLQINLTDANGLGIQSSLLTNTYPNTAPTVTFTYPGNNALILSGNVSLQAGAGDADNDAITFYWYINGSFNKTTTVNTTINFSRGNYAANVSANDGTTFSSNTTTTFNIDNNNITVHDTLQINFSGHNFSISGAFVDPDGASDIINASIITTAGNCNYRQNTTSGNLFNITYNCTGTSLTATTITVSANDTRSNTTKTTVTLFYPNSIPAQRHDLQFVNYTGHNFSVSYAVDDNDGALDIMFRNVSTTSGTCNYRQNTTSGTLFNITYNCTGTGIPTVQINISDINGTGTQSSLLTNTYPNTAPTVTFTYPGNNALIFSGNVSLQAGAGDADNDAITFYWYINGSFNKTTTVNTTINFSRGNYAANVSAYDLTEFSSNTTATFNIDNNNITVHDTLQINFSGHNFSISGAFVDPDGASDIINASIITTAGNCNYRQNTTSGNLFNITYNCTGTSLTATTITVSANDTRSNTTKTTVTLFYPNSIPAQRHDLLFVNYTNGAQFNVSYAVDDSDGAAEMMFRNVSITSGACSYVTNTTSGTLFNVTYNCTGPGASVATVQVNVSDINGTGTQSSLLANVYPVTTPTVAHNIQFVNYTNSHQFNASAAFLDLDGSGDIIRRNISSANCNYLANATSGNLLNITVNCSGTGLTLQKLHINVSDTTGGGINTTESNNTYPNQVPGQRHDLQFVNYTGHNFSVSYAVDDNDGALDIMFRNVSTTSGTCNYRQNTTSGTLFNITYNCTGTSLTTTTVQINISDINGTGTQSSLLTNTYPNQKPAQTNITFTVALTNSQVNLTWNASSDADGDVINYYVLVNGTLQCYTADRNCTFTPASQGQLLWNVTAYDGAENGTVSANNNFTFDSAAPTYYNFSSNASTVTTYNGSVLWVINISDNRQIDAYTFGFNSSGSFANDTPVTVSGVTKFASATKQINATKGKNVCARFYFNDSAGNTNSTTGSCFDVANAAAVFSPALADQSANSGQSFYYDVNCTDFDDDSITYSDNTALFVIDATTGEISDTPAESEVAANTVTITCNDGTVNKQESFVYTILDATAPTYTNLSNNASTVTQTNGAVNWSVTLADGVALKTVMFSFNNSGSFANDTPVTISGTSRAFNVTKTITAAAGKNVCGRFYFNDTSGNQNTTSNSCFNVRVNSNNSVPTTPAIVYPENNSYITSLPIALNSTSTDADGEAITYYHFINDTLNTTSSAANATMNASDGYYAYNAYASDGINDSSNSTKVFFTLDTTKPSISYGPATEATGSSFSRSWVYVNVTASDARESNITFYLYNTTHLYSSVTSTAKARSNNFTGLREGNYSYNVTIVDEAGNSNTTATRTLYLDTAAPVIGNLTVIEATNSTVVIFWNTNENSNDTVEYGLNTSYGSTASNSSNVTRHLVFISGLSQDTTYHYRVSSSDSVMNTNTTADNTFTMPRKIVNLVNTTANQTTTVNSSGIKVLIEIVTLSDSTNSFVNVTAGKETTVNRTVTEDLNVTPLKYVEVKVSGNLTTALSSALLRVDYNETEISDSNISEDTLAMYRYNASKNAWEKLNSTTMGWVLNTSVNTTLNYVWANVTNFSDYGVGGLLANGKPCTTNSSCSSNNCAKGFSSSNTWCAASGGCADNGVTYANGGTACNGDNLQTCSSGSWTSSSCANGCSSGACKAASSGGAGGGAGGGGGGGGGGAAAKQLLKDLTGRAGIRDLSLDANRLTHELTAGEGTTTILTLKNDGNADMQLKIEVKGKAEQLINVQESLTIKAKGTEKLPISIFVPVGTKEGTYSGEIVITSESEKIILPVSIKVKAPIGKEKLLDVRVQPLDTVVSPGDELKVRVDIYNLGEKGGRFDVQLLVELISAESNKTIEKSEEAIAIETSTSVLKLFEIPKDIELGKYIVKATATYSDKEGVHTATAIAHVRVQKPLIEVLKPYLFKKILFVKVWQLLLVMAAMPILLESALKYRAARKRRRRYVVAVNTGKLPKWGARAGWVGKVAETSTNAYVGVDDLTTHTIVAGATGSGKTIASQDIVEEALEKGTAVIVFDPAAQWTGFLRKCQAKQMLARYGAFGMGQKQARAYQGNIRQVTEPRELVDLKGLAEPGKITILALNKLTPKDIDVFVANTIRSVFMANFEESPKLKVLLVFDEVHRLLTKFGGSGDGLVQLERATREFRKWGIGLVLISQVLTDFVGEVKANIATQIQMRTSDEGDLERIKEKYGAVSASIIKASVGTGMLENAEYNDGRAYFVSFRPIRHSVTRLSDEELQKYNRFNDKIDEITSQISQLKELKIDVFDLEIELKLAKEKLSGGNFAMVEVYMESLEPKTKKAWEKLGRKPKAREKKLATIEDIKADVRKAKAERERIVIKENKEKENAGKAALKRGSILIINEKGAATAFKTLQKSLKQYGKGLCFTRTTKQAALAKYKLRNTEIKLITTEPVEGAYSPTSVSAMYGEIKDFISKNGSGAIMIDGMLLIISYAGFEQAYNLMQRIKDAIAAKKITCIIPINLEVLNKEQKKKLAEEFGAVSA